MQWKVAAIITTAVFLAACSRGSKQPVQAADRQPEPPIVSTATAERRMIDRSISVTGSLEPDETVSVSSEVPGRISAVLVDFGQSVRKGQVLVELEKRELALQVERARASLTQAFARLGLDSGQEDVRPDSTPQIRQAAAQMEDAKSKFDSAARLVKTGDISQERFIELEKSYRARQAALDAARDDMRTQLGSIAALRAEVKLAEKRLADATVRAPFDGAVGEKLVSAGQYTKENTPILTLVKTSPLRLRLEIPESAAGAVRTGTSLTFTTDAIEGGEFQAVVRELNPSLDPKSRSLTAEARLTRPDARLRPGMFVQVRLVLSRGNDVVVVPRRALYTLAGLTKVFVVRDGRIEEHRINPGQEIDGWVEVPRNTVLAGAQVVTGSLSQLVNGMSVRTKG